MVSPRQEDEHRYEVKDHGTNKERIVVASTKRGQSTPAWDDLTIRQSITTGDEEIKTGDVVLVNTVTTKGHTEDVPARVSEIRVLPDGEAFVKILWFYTPQNLRRGGVRGRVDLLPKKLLILSTIYEIFSLDTLNGVATERDLNQIDLKVLAVYDPSGMKEWTIADFSAFTWAMPVHRTTTHKDTSTTVATTAATSDTAVADDSEDAQDNVSSSDAAITSSPAVTSDAPVDDAPVDDASVDASVGEIFVDGVSVDDVSVDNTSVRDASVDDTSINDTSVNEALVDAPVDTLVDAPVGDPSIVDTSIDDASVGNQPVVDTSVDGTSVGNQPVVDTSVDGTSVGGTTLVGSQSVADQSVGHVSVGDVSIGDVDVSVGDDSIGHQPVVNSTAVGNQSVVDTTPVVDHPVDASVDASVDAPFGETSVSDQPVVDHHFDDAFIGHDILVSAEPAISPATANSPEAPLVTFTAVPTISTATSTTESNKKESSPSPQNPTKPHSPSAIAVGPSQEPQTTNGIAKLHPISEDQKRKRRSSTPGATTETKSTDATKTARASSLQPENSSHVPNPKRIRLIDQLQLSAK